MVTLIIKPTNNCNLHCEYCYLKEDLAKQKMTAETLEEIIKQSVNISDRLEFLWHGGEPLLMGVDFYRKVIELQNVYRKPKQKFRNTMQTNLTLLDEEFLAFFKKHKFGLGTSLDGPKDLHDKLRHYANHNGSYDDVMRGIKLMKDNDVHVGVITVLTKHHLNRIGEVYEFFKKENLNTKINPVFSEGRGAKTYEDIGITAKEYGTAMIEFFDLWFNDPKPKIQINSLEKYFYGLLNNKPKGCDFGEDCRKDFTAIDYKGDIFPCGRFNGYPEFTIGDIYSKNLKDVFRNQISTLGKRKVESCEPCKWYSLCNSGCMHDAYVATGNINSPDCFCQGIKMIYAHMEKAIDKELDKATENAAVTN